MNSWLTEERFAVGLIPILPKNRKSLMRALKGDISSSVVMEVFGNMTSGFVKSFQI